MFSSLTRRFREWQRLSRDIHRLKHLDDFLLADMGIRRECIAHTLRTGEK